ncbi:MAG: hypothetical protein IKO77_03375, partial [Bacteroidales bacterium]|nr:hypothetical protein [Bacteroidales bacterium]
MRKTDVLHSLIATDLGKTESDEDLHITISGHQENGGPMYQNITVIYFDTKEKADRFRYSPEGVGFDDPYGDGQDSFDLTALAGDPRLPGLIATILKNYFGFNDRSRLCAHTYCELDYFR